jgi:hypothetical protein
MHDDEVEHAGRRLFERSGAALNDSQEGASFVWNFLYSWTSLRKFPVITSPFPHYPLDVSRQVSVQKGHWEWRVLRQQNDIIEKSFRVSPHLG